MENLDLRNFTSAVNEVDRLCREKAHLEHHSATIEARLAAAQARLAAVEPVVAAAVALYSCEEHGSEEMYAAEAALIDAIVALRALDPQPAPTEE